MFVCRNGQRFGIARIAARALIADIACFGLGGENGL
jgi:hypothetical protein